jgi:hypothetical protein
MASAGSQICAICASLLTQIVSTGVINWSGENIGMDSFCRGVSDYCIFPFTYAGETYTSCTDVDLNGTRWCATKVDGEGNMMDNFWGICDMDTCKKEGR